MMDAENLTQMLHNKMAAEHQRPVYRHSGEYAREHGELEAFRASRQTNVACKEAIEATIQANFDGMYLNTDGKDVLAEFGPERVSYVFISMVRKEMEAMRKRAEQKPSIKAQLAAEPVPGDPPAAKPKDREVR